MFYVQDIFLCLLSYSYSRKFKKYIFFFDIYQKLKVNQTWEGVGEWEMGVSCLEGDKLRESGYKLTFFDQN